MGLLQEIRLMDGTHKDLQLEAMLSKQQQPYNPLFLSVVRKRGHFLMEKNSLANEVQVCLLKTGKGFYDWLKENNLTIQETKNYFKIYG